MRSEKNSTIWRTFRKGVCEYELEAVTASLNTYDAPSPLLLSNDRFVLANKVAHGEAGGIKFPSSTTPHVSSRTSLEPPRAFANRLRVSISEATRAIRLDSTDSNATAKLSSSLPAASTPKKKRRASKDEESDRTKDKAGTEQHSQSFSSATSNRLMRIKSKDKENKDKDKDEDKKKTGFFKRGIIAPFKNSLAQYEEKRAQKEERDRERQQAHSWAGSTNSPGWIHPSGKNTPPPLPSPTAPSGPGVGGGSARSSSAKTTSTIPSSVRTSLSDDQRHSAAPWLESESRRGSSVNLGLGSPSTNWKEGKAWAEVPEDAVAMIVPCNAGDTSDPNGDAASISTDTRQALLVWYVPFNSDIDERSASTTPRPGVGSSSGALASASSAAAEASATSPTVATSSLPKFQKLLRRRTSKDKDLVRNASQRSHEQEQPAQRVPRRPLPFRSFRVVARLVDIDDLRSEDLAQPSGSGASLFPDARKSSLSPPPPLASSVPSPRPAAASVDSALQLKPRLVTLQTNTTTSSSLSGSTAPTSTILAGRTISTVVAVCHSRSQGVEFVLEGLDRLGYCVGESAWGPTGYEEWRGTGLSDKGRELLDLLWAGCTAVMGLV